MATATALPDALAQAPADQTPMASSPQLSLLLERVSSLELSLQQLLSDHKQRLLLSSHHLLHLERQLESSSSPRFAPRHQPYSTLQDHPVPSVFQMPLHYPRYRKTDYDTMPEAQLDRLLEEYGLPVTGCLSEKRDLAIGTFLWRCQRD